MIFANIIGVDTTTSASRRSAQTPSVGFHYPRLSAGPAGRYLRRCEPRQRTRKVEADAAVLHALAVNEKNIHMRKRLLTLAYLAEGFSVDDAAVRARLAVHTVREHLRLFVRVASRRCFVLLISDLP